MHPRRAVVAFEETGCLRIAGNGFSLGIPRDLATGIVGDHGELHRSRGAVRFFDRATGGLAGAHGIQKFGHVEASHIGSGFIGVAFFVFAPRNHFVAIVSDENGFLLAI